MTSISIVIPHRGRDELLLWNLRELQNQVFEDFEVIVVIDEPEPTRTWIADYSHISSGLDDINLPIEVLFSGGKGPGISRNIGAKHARSDIILFLGSDCIPDPHLVSEHYYSHIFDGADIVQGHTPFHSEVITEFYVFLENSGLQAAWGNLKNEDGTFKREITPAFCLTTNYSINRQLFLNEQFDDSFSGAAWEDVELGYRMSKYNTAVKTIFNHNAVNYHYHRYDLDSFVQRSKMEGYHRLTICKIHPEMGWGMVNPFDLRTVKDLDESEVLAWAKELEYITAMPNEDIKDLIEKKYQRYGEACRVFSLKGVLERIKDEHPAMQAIEHVHSNAQIIQILSGVTALNMGNWAYAAHTAQWFTSEREDDWSGYSYLGEVELAMENTEEAVAAFRKSVEINPGAQWPKDRLKELL